MVKDIVDQTTIFLKLHEILRIIDSRIQKSLNFLFLRSVIRGFGFDFAYCLSKKTFLKRCEPGMVPLAFDSG